MVIFGIAYSKQFAVTDGDAGDMNCVGKVNSENLVKMT